MRRARDCPTAELIHDAKISLLDALRAAEKEHLPQSLVRQIETLTAKAEALHIKLAERHRNPS